MIIAPTTTAVESITMPPVAITEERKSIRKKLEYLSRTFPRSKSRASLTRATLSKGASLPASIPVSQATGPPSQSELLGSHQFALPESGSPQDAATHMLGERGAAAHQADTRQ